MNNYQFYCLLFSTHIIVYVLGILTKAYSNYYGQLFTDKRKQKEHKTKIKNNFNKLSKISSKFILELKSDIKNDPLGYIRNIGVIGKNIQYFGKPMFRYDEEIYPDILDILSLMETFEFVQNVTIANSFPKYKISEELIEFINK